MTNCINNRVQELITDYFSGHLNPADQSEVEIHLDQCSECRETFKVMQLLAGRDKNDKRNKSEKNGDKDHLTPEQMLRYLTKRELQTKSEKALIEDHLRDCDECTYDLDFLKSMENELYRSIQVDQQNLSLLAKLWQIIATPLRQPALVYLLLLLSIYPATMYLLQPKQDIRMSSDQIDVDIELVLANRQGNGETTIVRKHSDGFIRLNIPHYHLVSDFRYEFSLRDENDKEQPIELFSSFDAPAKIVLLSRLTDLPDGTYTLFLSEIERAAPQDTTITYFQIRLKTVND